MVLMNRLNFYTYLGEIWGIMATGVKIVTSYLKSEAIIGKIYIDLPSSSENFYNEQTSVSATVQIFLFYIL